MTRPVSAAVVTIDESFSGRLMGLDFEFFEDASGQLDFATIQQQEFKPNLYQVSAFGFAKSTYWYRFSLRNVTDLERRLYLELAIAWIDSFSLFSKERGQWVRRDAGVAVPLQSRSVTSNLPTHEIDLPAQNEATFYLRISSSDTLLLPIYLFAADSFTEHMRLKELLYGIFAGIMVVAAFYGFIFFVYTFNRAYFYYFLNTMSWLVMFGAWDGYTREFVFGDNFWWNKNFNVIMVASSLVWGALFTMKILEIPSYSKPMTRVIQLWLGMQIVLVLSVFVLPYAFTMQVTAFIGLMYPFLLGATGITALRHKMKIARYYLLSWIFPIVGIIFFNAMIVGWVPGSPLIVYALHYSVLLQSLFLSFMLSYHLRQATRNASTLKVSVEAAGLAHSALMKNELDSRCFELSYRYCPCQESGGDVMSCLEDPRGYFSYIAVADISGHGITAAIISAAFTGAMNAAVKGLYSTDLSLEQSCKKVMNDLNSVMCDYYARTDHFASAAMVGVDKRDGQAIYLNAGHRNIFVKNGTKVSALLRGGSLLGFQVELSVLIPVPFHLTEGDMLLLFTDGLIDNEFGGSAKRRFDLMFDSLKNNSRPQPVLDAIWQVIGTMKQNLNYEDDMTLLVIKVKSLLPASSESIHSEV